MAESQDGSVVAETQSGNAVAELPKSSIACPLRLPNEKCSGNGNALKCAFYDKNSGRCYKPLEEAVF